MKNLMNLPEMLFAVEKVELSSIAPNMVAGASDLQYAIVGDIDGVKTVLNVCSSRYNLVPNEEVFLPIEQELTARGIKYEANYSNVDNAKFYADYILKEEGLQIGNGDEIFPKISVTHSYNGLLNYSLTVGYFRLICSNGLVVPVEGQIAYTTKGKHTPKLDESIKMFFTKLDLLLDSREAVQEGYEKMAATKVTDVDETILSLMDAIGMKGERETKAGSVKTANFDFAKEVLLKEAKELGSDVNMWLIYNAINGAIFSDELNKKHDEFRAVTDGKLMDRILSLV